MSLFGFFPPGPFFFGHAFLHIKTIGVPSASSFSLNKPPTKTLLHPLAAGPGEPGGGLEISDFGRLSQTLKNCLNLLDFFPKKRGKSIKSLVFNFNFSL